MPINYSIAEGIQIFTDDFDFCGKSNTKRTYLRALSLFKEFLESNSVIKNSEYLSLNISSPLLSLPKNIASSFSTWLQNQEFPIEYHGKKPKSASSTYHPTPPTSTRKYSIATVNLYITAFGRFLVFWQDRELISFNVLRYKKRQRDSSTSKLVQEVSVKANAIPCDLGIVLLKISRKWVSELSSESPRVERLKRLRARALISVLTNTGLRASDIVTLTKNWRKFDINSDGITEIYTVRSGIKAYCKINKSTLAYVDEYIEARGDMSPWLFIQHGKSGTNTATNVADYSRENNNSNGLRRCYGAPITRFTVQKIVRSIANLAGYNKNDHVTTQAIRHWLAKYMCDNDVPLEQIQVVLGHSSVETTRVLYPPRPSQELAKKCIQNLQARLIND